MFQVKTPFDIAYREFMCLFPKWRPLGNRGFRAKVVIAIMEAIGVTAEAGDVLYVNVLKHIYDIAPELVNELEIELRIDAEIEKGRAIAMRMLTRAFPKV